MKYVLIILQEQPAFWIDMSFIAKEQYVHTTSEIQYITMKYITLVVLVILRTWVTSPWEVRTVPDGDSICSWNV